MRTRADAAWVGWGFVAEHPDFAAMCERLGVRFIGPSSEVMRRLGDKITSKQVAESSDVPVAPWSGGPVATIEDARAHAARLGYPLLIKATAGGGGRGIRRVESLEELDTAFDVGPRRGARRVRQRHRVPRDARAPGQAHRGADHRRLRRHGLAGRRARLQRAAAQPEAARGVAVALADRRAGQRGARRGGPPRRRRRVRERRHRRVPVRPSTGEFCFMEVNARLQVEHPVTELTTGVDMVKLQLHVAAGGLLEGTRRRRSATRSRRGSTPRTPTPASRRPRAGSSCSGSRPDPACASTTASRRATRSPPSSTR